MTTSPMSTERTAGRIVCVLLAATLVASACGDGGGADDDAAAPTSTTAPSRTAPPAVTDTDVSADCASVPTGVSELVLDAGGAEHDVQVYVPTTYDGRSELPLVVNFHGFASNGRQQAAVTGYEGLAEEEGFIVAHPTAVPASTDESRRSSWELADIDDPAKDDVAFTNALLDLLIDEYCVDETHVYATGMSGGGLFTSRLVCDMSDRIAAASSVAGLAHSESCDPARPVPFMAIHGTEDDRVPFDGDLTGTWFADEEFAQALFSEPMPDQFAQFAETMGCDPEGERVQQSTDVVATTYTGCDDDVPLVFYEVVDGGHTWPSSPLADMLTDFQGYITFDIDATADSWAFFEQHPLEP